MSPPDKHDKNWTWTNYLSARALAQADNVRNQLQRTMERYEVELVSIQDERKLWLAVRQALVCGFFMQVAHKEGDKGNYLTVKDNQVRCLSFPPMEFREPTELIVNPSRLLRCTLPVDLITSLSGSCSTSLCSQRVRTSGQ